MSRELIGAAVDFIKRQRLVFKEESGRVRT
jgi:hypothetical protein